MQHNLYGYPDISSMRKELADVGVKELKTAEEVDRLFRNQKGPLLLVINSICGCAAKNARPALKLALKHQIKPKAIYSVFAGQDKEATSRAREYFSEYPPSSPSFVFFKNGKAEAVVPRNRIEDRTASEIAEDLTNIFDAVL